MAISAQVSLYPLRQQRLTPAIDEALRVFQEYGLDIAPGSMSTVITGDDAAVFAVLQEVFRRTAEQGHVVMTVTFSNACPMPDAARKTVAIQPIGHVQNAFDEPVSAAAISAAESQIVLDPELAEGLIGLAAGQQIMVLFHFHRAEGYEMLQHPRGDASQPKRGVFALRTPHRPARIGVTVAELLAIDGNILRVRGLDALNGTPVLDLKPA